MATQHDLQQKYPGARAWGFGDSPRMADELGALVASALSARPVAITTPGVRTPIQPCRGITISSSTARASHYA